MRRDNKSHWALTTFSFAFAALIGFSLVQASRSYGIPAFSRKYQTSCATCHNDFPELNDFGQAFKKNGFRFPKDDESFVKEPPVMLGARAQKEAFPKAIYPGEIPGSIPIAFRYSGVASYTSKQPLAVGYLPQTDLFMPNTFTIIAAGSMGERLSFWVDNDISAGGANAAAGLGDGYIKINDLGHYIGLPKDALNLRMGQFELDLPFTQARSINLSSYDIYNQAGIAGIGCMAAPAPCQTGQGTTNNPFMFSIPQRGIEISGYRSKGNFEGLEWSAAVADGSNNGPALRNSKDVYLRVSQRFNLERDPASRNEVQAAGPTGPRDHTSLRLGGFYYYGRNALNPDQSINTIGTIEEPFYRAGADFRFRYRQLELYGLGMYGHDQNHMLVTNGSGTVTSFVPAGPVTFTGGFAQANYWFYPWLIGIMRYDVVNSPTDFQNGVSRFNTRNRLSPGVQFLIRANLKWDFEYQYKWQQPIPNSQQFFRLHGFETGFDYLF
jgi:hypothetical protein